MTDDKFAIYKCQVSLLPVDGVTKVLVYNQDHSVSFALPMTEDVKEIMKGRAKAYFYGHLNKDTFMFDDEVEKQDW